MSTRRNLTLNNNAVTAVALSLASVPSLIASQAGLYQEYIHYFDDSRPPVIEHYAWDDTKRWQLQSVHFDSDGDWALDTAMHFSQPSKELSTKDLEARRKIDEQYKVVKRDGARFSPYFEEVKNVRRLYPRKLLYDALKLDKTFRLSSDGALRSLEPPLPSWPGNFDRRYSAAYKGLLKRLMEIKLAPIPPIVNAE